MGSRSERARLATPQDIAFLRLAISHAITDKPTAERCLQLVDEGLRRGEALTAPHVAMNLGIVTRETAERLWELARASLAQAPNLGETTQRFQKPIAAPPPGTWLSRPPTAAPQTPPTAAPRPSSVSSRPPMGVSEPPPPTVRPPTGAFEARPPLPSPGSRPPLGAYESPPGARPPTGAFDARAVSPPSGAGPATPATATPRATGRYPTAPSASPASSDLAPSAPPPTGRYPASPERLGSATGRFPPQALPPLATARFSSTATTAGEEVDVEAKLNSEGYELILKLGRGPSGTTYDLRRRGDPKLLAGKVLSRKFAKHPPLYEQILGELKRAQGFDHPSVVSLREIVSVAGRDLLVFDKAEGETLAARLKSKGPLTTLHATEVVIDLAKCLVQAHARGIFHGDIRPAKLFIDSRGRVRLADFGLSQASCLSAGYGQFGLAFGTPEYLAPEAVQEKLPRPNARTDVYALGVLYYELACGVAPFRGANGKETLRAHLERTLPPPPEDVKVSTAMAGVILRMTAKDPEKRFADMASALRAVEDYKQARARGLTSDPDGDAGAAVPLDADRPISAAEWGKQSEDAAERSSEWKPEKIEAPDRVGPEEWTPDQSMEGGPVARWKTDDDEDVKPAKKGGYSDALRAVAGPGESSPEAIAAEAARREKREKAAQGGRGNRFELRGNTETAAAVRRSRVLLTLVLISVPAALGAAYLNGRKLAEQPLPPQIAPSAPPAEPKPTPPPLASSDVRTEHDRAVRALLDARTSEVHKVTSTADWKRALEVARAPGGAFGNDRTFQDGQQRLVTEVRDAARAALARDRDAIDELLKTDKIARAEEIARRAQASAPDELRSLAGALSDLIAAAKTSDAKELGQVPNAPEGWDASGLADRIAQTVRGTVHVRRGLAIDLEYRGAESGFDVDWTVVAGKRPRSVPGDGGGGVRLEATSEPLLLIHRLPFVRPVSVRLEFTVPAKVPKESVVAVLAGARRDLSSGAGASWGLIPVSLTPAGLVPDPRERRPPLGAGPVHVFEISYAPPLPDGRVLVGTTLDDQKPTKRSPVDVEALKGSFAISARGVDVTLSLVRITGVLDVQAFEKLKAEKKK
jgi:serine/threonine protein kinase